MSLDGYGADSVRLQMKAAGPKQDQHTHMLEIPEVTLAPGACDSDLLIAEHFLLKVATTPLPETWQLLRHGGRMTLQAPADAGGYQLELNLTEGPMARRVRTARRTDSLPRAIGMHRRRVERIIDATAGLGRDAMVLSALGCAVTAIERVPALCFLLQVAVKESAANIDVVHGDAVEWLRAHAEGADPAAVVYLDPMFSDPKKAQVKKEMQACRALAGPPTDTSALLAAARAAARDRVVVKRHPQHPPLADDVSFEVRGDRVRFDVYLTSGAS